MKGFVIALRRARDEDSIAVILSEHSIGRYYRFFGARHSILQLGHLIDFEIENDDNRYLPRLRNLSQIRFKWLTDHKRLMFWHNFIKLFEPHLRDTQDLDSFYYELLLKAAKKWGKQNPKRIIIESYIELLRFEGRLYPLEKCYICEQPIKDTLSLMHALKPAHPECIYAASLDRDNIKKCISTGKSINLDDRDIDISYDVVMKGF